MSRVPALPAPRPAFALVAQTIWFKRAAIGFFFLGVCLWATGSLEAQEKLPKGSPEPALVYDYFPSKAQAVVWRNWNLVSAARIAKVLGCRETDVRDMASAMGLGPAMPIPDSYHRRMYITVLRRNWHLLPYDQLLTLLDMTEEQLAMAMRNDDFLYVKLGNTKPRCAPVIYRKPDALTRRKTAAFRQVVEKYFGTRISQPSAPRFDFVRMLEAADTLAPLQDASGKLRFLYSYFGVFGDPLMDASLDPYPDGLLAQLSSKGVTGVWLHVVLNELAPGGSDFPVFGAGHGQRIQNLQRLVARAKRRGIRVYLYINEPRAMPSSFFGSRPEMAGVHEGDLTAMCTSDPRVEAWITRSLAYVFRAVPDLGGVFTITASENLTNCASHGHWQDCPRCRKRSYEDIIVDVNRAIEMGVHRGNPDAKVIVWDWGWRDTSAAAIIARLPSSCWFMSVSEWGIALSRGGIPSTVGEYAMSVGGPGDRARGRWAMARNAGLKTVAKVQVNNTWEFSAIPWLPVADLVAGHISRLTRLGIDGLMLSWSLGGYPSPNLDIVHAIADHPFVNKEAVLDSLAVRRYGAAAAPSARAAWTTFSDAFAAMPYAPGLLYKAPQQYGPANVLFDHPTGYKATMVGFPYDDLDGWRGPYPPSVFVSQFRALQRGWEAGLQVFAKVVDAANANKKAVARKDLGLAQAAYEHFRSVANQAAFIMVRDSLLQHQGYPEVQIRRLKSLLDDEIASAISLYDLTKADSRIGFEASNQYYYVPQDLIEKVVNCTYIRQRLSH